jgi:hypothetical protein
MTIRESCRQRQTVNRPGDHDGGHGGTKLDRNTG